MVLAEEKIRVLVVDDSALVRTILQKILNGEPDIQVVGSAANAIQAREMIQKLHPDVLTLDVEMPQMDGLVFLEQLMRDSPMPVLMVSSQTEQGSETALRALELGAVDCMPKPQGSLAELMQGYAKNLAERVRAVSRSRVMRTEVREEKPAVPEVLIKQSQCEKIIAVGSSTGGTEAVKEFLRHMPANAPPILITQHMPESFTRAFAARLDSLCKIRVTEANHNEVVQPGHAYIAPGHSHLLLARSGGHYVTQLSRAEPVNHHRPSVEVLFRSVAMNVGRDAIGVMLTGMGKDGAIAMLEMRRAGAYNLAQDEASCVVFGMPREAIAVGAVHEVAPIEAMAQRVLQHLADSGASH